MAPQGIPDQAQTILAPLQVDNTTKALAWDAFHGSADEDEFAEKIKGMGLPQDAKASLWEAKRQQKVHTTGPGVMPPPQTGSAPLSYAAPIQANIAGLVGSGFGKSASQTARSALAPNGRPSILGKLLAPLVPGFAKEGAGQAGIGDNPEPQNPIAPGLQVDKTTGYDPLAPKGAAETTGAVGEQALEMLLMGKIAPKAPSIITRMGSSAAQTGVDAIAHNQDPKTAALIGAGGSLTGELANLGATKLTGAAMNSTPTQAKAILSELTGITPKQISKQAAVKSMALTGQMEQLAANSTLPASTKPAIDIIDKEMAKATAQNNQPYFENLGKLKSQLTQEFATGNQIPQNIPAKQILDLKRGVGGLINSWDAPARNSVRTVTKQVYAALDNELDKAVPGAGELNDRITNLIGAGKAANKTSKATLTNVLRQGVARSAGATIGGVVGGQKDGSGGAIKGALLGALLSSPSAGVAASRAALSPITGSAIKALALQLDNKNVLPPEDQ